MPATCASAAAARSHVAINHKREKEHAHEHGEHGDHGHHGAPATAKLPTVPEPEEVVREGFWKYQIPARDWYDAVNVQWGVAGLIVANLIVNILEKELDPVADKYKSTWRALEHTFNAIFLGELLINMYGHWLKPFWRSSWNIFDVIVVSVGCVSFVIELKGPLKLLRTLRAFRVMRLFKRIKSLNKIIVMIVSAVPGVSSAFFVMVLAISIYSLIGVELFLDFGQENATELGEANEAGFICGYKNVQGDVVSALTTREICYGSEYFGTFTRAWFTLFQVLTGESWSEAVARPILYGWDEYGEVSQIIAAFYFISFVLVNAFVLFNVFVAILLDRVVAGGDDDGEGDADTDEGEKHEPSSAVAAVALELEPITGSKPVELSSTTGVGSTEHVKALQDRLTEQSRTITQNQAELRDMLGMVLARLSKIEASMGLPQGPSPPPQGSRIMDSPAPQRAGIEGGPTPTKAQLNALES